MKIQILGTGCPKCEKTAEVVKEVVKTLGIEAEIEKVTDLNEIMTFNVMSTPAVAIDGQVKISGRVPSHNELKKILQPDATAVGNTAPKKGQKKNIITVVALLAAIAAVVALKNHKPESAATASNAVATLPKLLDLGAGKCVPCKMMEPILHELTETYTGKLNVEFIDVWENKAEAEKYEIRMIPTQIFFDADGKELFRHEGFYSKEDILAKWAELGVEL